MRWMAPGHAGGQGTGRAFHPLLSGAGSLPEGRPPRPAPPPRAHPDQPPGLSAPEDVSGLMEPASGGENRKLIVRSGSDCRASPLAGACLFVRWFDSLRLLARFACSAVGAACGRRPGAWKDAPLGTEAETVRWRSWCFLIILSFSCVFMHRMRCSSFDNLTRLETMWNIVRAIYFFN